MTKAEELKLLDQIDALIKSADPGDYIPMTFAGIVEVCRKNIENDFGDSPVSDLDDMREAYFSESRMHDETKRMLADSQKMCKEAMDENDRLRKLVAEWEQNAHDAGEMYAELEQENTVLTAEIRKLKAEIVSIKFDRMTEEDMAMLYDKMEGA